MDHVFGAFPDDKPQEKKNLGQWQGVVEYAGGEPWSPAADPQWFDVARRLHPDEDGPYTWWTYRGQAFNNNAGWRIDYQAATRPMLERAQRTWWIRPLPWSSVGPTIPHCWWSTADDAAI